MAKNQGKKKVHGKQGRLGGLMKMPIEIFTEALEENRERNNVRKAKERRIERRARVDRFLIDMRYKAHPFAPILDALGVGVPSPPNLDIAGGSQSSLSTKTLRMANPFPKTRAALEWDCLIDLSEVDMSMEEVEAKLEERRAQIEKKVLEWRTIVERRLVERFESGTSTADDNIVVLVKGSTDLTTPLPRTTRLLLRADTLFKSTVPALDVGLWETGGHPRCYYPAFVPSSNNILTKEVDFSSDEDSSLDEDEQEVTLNQVMRDFEAENIVKRLLRDLGMPDVAHVELDVMGANFLCGRCTDGDPETWAGIVGHYIRALRFWDKGKHGESAYHLQHPVAFRNVHDLDDSEPLAREVARKSRSRRHTVPPLWWCYLCQGTGRSLGRRLRKRDMVRHLRDVHNIKESLRDMHYGRRYYNGDEWHKKWDAYHDSHSTVAGTSALAVTSVEP
ncbi:hypothetical protein FRC06_003681 [Ceratobasidium sp. 370]|nr:hypothetical protein FRC06_003681 [Ceratobasidium sp. 370]